MSTHTVKLKPEQVEQYHRTGYLVLRQWFTEEEAKQWQQECERLLTLDEYTDPDNLRSGYRVFENGERVIERIDPVHDISPVFNNLTKSERILNPVRQLFNNDTHLFKDKLIFKLPGVSGYTMHQDASWWQGFPYKRLLSVMVAIDGATKENGGLELFPGYHHQLITPTGELRNMNEEEIAQIDQSRGELVETRPGDIIIFHSLAPHQSGPNTANYSRRQLYLTYSDAKYGDLYRDHQQHYHRYTTNAKSEEEKKRVYFK